MFKHRKLADRKEWAKINVMFFDVEAERLVYARGKAHNGRGGLPLLMVDFLSEDRAPGPRDGFGKNVPETDAKALIADYPQRSEDGYFYDRLIQVINHRR